MAALWPAAVVAAFRLSESAEAVTHHPLRDYGGARVHPPVRRAPSAQNPAHQGRRERDGHPDDRQVEHDLPEPPLLLVHPQRRLDAALHEIHLPSGGLLWGPLDELGAPVEPPAGVLGRVRSAVVILVARIA